VASGAPPASLPCLASPAMGDPRQHLGRLGERLALEHLNRLGYRLVSANHRTRFGELDLIVSHDSTLVFVEVKTRRAPVLATYDPSGRPWESLHERKRAQVRRMAAAWLAETADRPHARELRFDAIGVTVDATGALRSLEHLENAF
jgi:putative endonuclease